MLTCTGTLEYKAPELFRGGIYDEMIDEWAVGVTIYQLITGRTPFYSEHTRNIIENIESGVIDFDPAIWNTQSLMLARDLIKKLVCPRESREKAGDLLKWIWFEGHSKILTSIAPTRTQHKI